MIIYAVCTHLTVFCELFRFVGPSACAIEQLAWFTAFHSFIHSGHFYSAPSSPLLLRGAPVIARIGLLHRVFHSEARRQLHVKDLPKVPTWRLDRESNLRPSG